MAGKLLILTIWCDRRTKGAKFVIAMKTLNANWQSCCFIDFHCMADVRALNTDTKLASDVEVHFLVHQKTYVACFPLIFI